MCKSGGWHFILAAVVALLCAGRRRAGGRSRRALPKRKAASSAKSASPATAASSPRRSAPICRFNVGDAYDAGKVDQSIKSLFATGLFSDVRIDREGAGVRRHGGREPGHQPGGLRGQPRGRQGDADERGAAQAALRLHARQGAGRRAAHSRRLPPAGPLCRLRRAQDHRARQQPREPRVRDQRGRRDQGQGHQLHRQPGLLRLPAARHHHHHAVGPVRLPQGHQHLRSRPPVARSRAAAAVLPEERLCRRARRLGRRRARPRRLGLLHHLRGRRGRAVQLRHDRHRVRRCPTSIPRPCAASC